MSTPPSQRRCPICEKPVAPRAENPSFPFCNPRCRMVDLGRWLGEEYRVAGEGDEPGEERPEGRPVSEDEMN